MPKRVTVKTPVRRFSVKPRVELLEDRLVPAAMLPGFDGQTLAGNDDGSTGAVNLGFTLNFFGTSYSQVFVNNNGNITFGSASSQFTPSALTNSGQTPRIAAFFADVDTRAGNSVTYGTGTVDSHAAFAANWPGVGYYGTHIDKLNKFQIVLVSRADRGAGDFDIQLNYDQIQWETGDASGGSGGLGGTAARLGYTSGSGNAGTYFELSGATRAFLDSSQFTGLIHQHFNSDVEGRFVFSVHGGEVLAMPLPLNLSVSGAINATNPSNDWTFFDRANHTVTVNVHTGDQGSAPHPLSPALNYAQVQLLDDQGHVLGTAANTQTGTDVSIVGVTLPADGVYHVHVTASPDQPNSTGNYIILAGDATTHTYPLTLDQVEHGQLYSPFAIDRWTFTGTANQQVQFNLLGAANTGIQFDLAGAGSATLFSNLTASSDPVTLPTTGDYVLTVHSANGQAGAYSFSLNQIAVSTLTLGTPYTGTLLASGQIQLFKVDVAAGNPLLVRLDDSTDTDNNEVYVRRGSPPTRGTYDYRFGQAGADQDVQVPFATPGTWYILVYSRTVPSPSHFTLVARTNPVFLNTVTPDSYATDQTVAMTLSGSGFLPGTHVTLELGGTTAATAQQVQVNSFSQLTATFDLHGVPTGTYDVRVTLPGGTSALLAGAFKVLAAGQAHLETHLILPGVLGRHATATLYVEYANTGNVSMPAPILTLENTNGLRPLLTLDQSLLTQGFWTSALPKGFSNSVQIYASGAVAGVLQPGERIRVPVYYAGLQQPWDFSNDNVQHYDIRIHDAGSTEVVDWAGMKDAMRPSWIPADAWDGVFANLRAVIGTTWGDYVSMLHANAVYLGQLGLKVSDVNELFSFAMQQALGLNSVSPLASAGDAYVPTPGLALDFTRSFGNDILSRYQTGPFGRGWTAPWQISLEEQADGTIVVHEAANAQRIFQPDSRTAGAYFSQPGDSGVLRKVSGGAWELTETSGRVMRFRADHTVEYLQDINGNRITAGFTAGQLTSLTHSSGGSIAITYNGAGLIGSITSFATAADITGRTISYTYDATNTYLSSATGPEGTTSYTYDTGSNPASKNALLS
ncbi:MAG TPA: nidogen-like domain-containing protein, partial [Gemmataceae bacterium]|nr:nidogen-like domain-containing protein [Gemmataceae bacterium]